jgi:hypothetical protein
MTGHIRGIADNRIKVWMHIAEAGRLRGPGDRIRQDTMAGYCSCLLWYWAAKAASCIVMWAPERLSQTIILLFIKVSFMHQLKTLIPANTLP